MPKNNKLKKFWLSAPARSLLVKLPNSTMQAHRPVKPLKKRASRSC